MITYTTNELTVFHSICSGKSSAKDLEESTGLPRRTIYDLVHSLERKKTVTVEKGRNGAMVPSKYLHASALKQILLLGTPPLKLFVGGKLLILLSIASRPKELSQISKETGLKESSITRLMLELKHYGLTWQDEKGTVLTSSATHVKRFLEDFSKGACMAILEDKAKKGVLLWNDGLQFIFSTTELDDAEGVFETGVSAMAERGLKFFLYTGYFYYSFCRHEPSSVEVALHTILADPISPRAIGIAMLFLKKKGFDETELLQAAKALGLEVRAGEMIDFLNGKDIDDPTFPDRRDANELFRQYEVA